MAAIHEERQSTRPVTALLQKVGQPRTCEYKVATTLPELPPCPRHQQHIQHLRGKQFYEKLFRTAPLHGGHCRCADTCTDAGTGYVAKAKAGTFAVHPPMICQHAVAPEGQQTRAHKNARIGMKSRLCSRPLSNRMRCHRQQSNSPGAALEGPLLLGCQLGTPVSPSLPYRWHAGVWSKGLNTRAN